MKSNKSCIARVCGAFLAGVLALGNTLAASSEDSYPDKPIRMIAPFSAGGFTDYGARLLAEKLSQELKQPVIVENRVGAGSSIGSDVVARSTPDGYTLLVTTQSFSVNPFLFKSISYDSDKDFRAVAQVAISPMVLYTNPNVPANSTMRLPGTVPARISQLSCFNRSVAPNSRMCPTEAVRTPSPTCSGATSNSRSITPPAPWRIYRLASSARSPSQVPSDYRRCRKFLPLPNYSMQKPWQHRG
ncbi:hypothetical protein BOMU111920_01095 [Bordetella muralis]